MINKNLKKIDAALDVLLDSLPRKIEDSNLKMSEIELLKILIDAKIYLNPKKR